MICINRIEEPKIVVIGGGTGLSTMLRGLKKFTSNITAVVTVGDDGGGSGMLREDLGMLPPGDIRNCIMALADTEPLMEDLLQYRFKNGRLKNQSFGNLFLAAMNGISTNFEEAVQKMSSVLAVTGKVLPVTLDNMTLKAKMKNKNIIEGESQIPVAAVEQKTEIDRLFIEPDDAVALKEAVDDILEADGIVIGPGSLYTSIIPNLLVKNISKALRDTGAVKLYVCNIMTQQGETDNYSAYDHVKAIFKHTGDGVVDYVLANNGEINKTLEQKYLQENSKLVKLEREKLNNLGVGILEDNFVKIKDGYVRHDANKLSKKLIDIIINSKNINNEKNVESY